MTQVHIALGRMGAENTAELIALPSAPIWSETMSSPGTTTRSVPSGPGWDGRFFFDVNPTNAVYVAVGNNPDATQASGEGNAARYLIQAGVSQKILCRSGHRCAWAPA